VSAYAPAMYRCARRTAKAIECARRCGQRRVSPTSLPGRARTSPAITGPTRRPGSPPSGWAASRTRPTILAATCRALSIDGSLIESAGPCGRGCDRSTSAEAYAVGANGPRLLRQTSARMLFARSPRTGREQTRCR